MLLPMLASISLARAASFVVLQSDIDAAAQLVLPQVEQAMGRRFDVAPVVGATDSTERCRLDRAAAPPDATPPSCEPGALSDYQADADRIWLFRDAMNRVLARMDEGDRGAFALRCVLAHELAHALQAREGALAVPADEAEAGVHHALVEGQAILVERLVCSERSSLRLAAAVQRHHGHEADGVLDPGNRRTRVDSNGTAFVETVHSRTGMGGVWWALDNPPTERLLVAGAASGVPAAWTDGSLLDGVARIMAQVDGETVGPMAVAPTASTRLRLGGVDGPAPLLSGVHVTTPGDFQWASMTAWFVATPGVAEQHVARLRKEVRTAYWSNRSWWRVQSRVMDGYYDGEPRVVPVRGASAGEGVRAAMGYTLLRTTVWRAEVATGHALVVLTTVGKGYTPRVRKALVRAALIGVRAAGTEAPVDPDIERYLALAQAEAG